MKNIKIIVEDKELELSEETSKIVMSELKKEKKEFPQIGDNYWIIEDDGGKDCFSFDDDDVDTEYLKVGNFYKTEELVDKEIAKREAIVRVKNYIKDNFGYDPNDWADWEDGATDKYTIYYNYKESEIDSDFTSDLKYNSFIGYIKTYDECEILIKNCKEDLELICK